MKHFSLPIIGLCISLLSSAQNYSGASWASVVSSGGGSIKLSYVETPKFVYHDESGQLTGISVDIMNDFVDWVNRTKGVKLQTQMMGEGTSFSAMYQKVKASSGGVFGLGNITITDERKREIKFSPAFITNFAVLVSNGSLSALNQFEELPKTFKGGKAYTAKGTTNEKRMISLKQRYYPDMEIKYTATSQETLDNIVSDPFGFGYLDIAFYLDAVQARKNIKRHSVGDMAAEQFAFIMPTDSDWATVMDEFFKADGGYLTSSRYKAILLKHLGEAGMKMLRVPIQ